MKLSARELATLAALVSAHEAADAAAAPGCRARPLSCRALEQQRRAALEPHGD